MATQVDKSLWQCFLVHTFPFLTASISQHTHIPSKINPVKETQLQGRMKPTQRGRVGSRWCGGERDRERERPHLRRSALKTPSWGVGGSQNPACFLLTLARSDLRRKGSHPHPLPFFFSNKGSVCSPSLLLLHTKVLPVLEMCYKISGTSGVTSPITATTTSFFTYTRLQLGFLSFVTKTFWPIEQTRYLGCFR